MSSIRDADAVTSSNGPEMEVDDWNFLYKVEEHQTVTMTFDHVHGWERAMGLGNTAVFVFPVASTGDTVGSKLLNQVTKALLAGGFPSVKEIFDGRGWMISRQRGAMLEKLEGGYRYDGAEFVTFGCPSAFWPPPFSWEGAGGSVIYEFTTRGLSMEKAQELLSESSSPMVALYRQVDGKGDWLPDKYFLRCVNAPDDGKVLRIGGITMRPVYRCSFCWRGFPSAEAHTSLKCPLVSTMNKARKAAGYPPIKASETSCPDIPKEKVAIDVEKELEGVKGLLAKLSARLDKLEKSLGDKSKDKSGQEQRGSKRKADAPPANENKSKKAKKGKGKKSGEKDRD
ncbi:uncharacterized protein LACBIDRAFT_324510 [Laccaria bicolor S238N-H82]|uniref:Predicted protein n=1 Tax=Laccaria bicolor (strain S238N-H82 / ATCC MYA-4686) TaxID=486041 RepID=B0D245_LACBS|nr:uncharacterized protein LACBIDRAFT_324510 [Laccaria bicolor S238N-H82]EDR11037.1 predicted protein [Laccaria bicolor S238N-H82]|eukprot:XP_001878338.1 predicted protein [Laccaria bicolor S238N-H82]